jgi:hypothetical protein
MIPQTNNSQITTANPNDRNNPMAVALISAAAELGHVENPISSSTNFVDNGFGVYTTLCKVARKVKYFYMRYFMILLQISKI